MCYSAIKENTPRLGGKCGGAAYLPVSVHSTILRRVGGAPRALRVFARRRASFSRRRRRRTRASPRRRFATRNYVYIYTCPLLFVASRFVERRQAGDVPRRANMAHSLSIHRYVRSKHLCIVYVQRTEGDGVTRNAFSYRRFLRIRGLAFAFISIRIDSPHTNRSTRRSTTLLYAPRCKYYEETRYFRPRCAAATPANPHPRHVITWWESRPIRRHEARAAAYQWRS